MSFLRTIVMLAALAFGSVHADATRTLTIYWTRHALSCANIHNEHFGGRPRNHSVYWKEPDPILSDCGAYQAQQNAKDPAVAKLRSSLDGVYSSSLLRTMQTAATMYGAKVTPLPFISEIPNDGTELAKDGSNITDHQDNPVSIEDQRKALAKLGIEADFRWMKEISSDEQFLPGHGRLQWRLTGYPIDWQHINETWVSEKKRDIAQAAMGQFLNFVQAQLLPTLPSKPALHIAVADHGTLMGNWFHPSKDEGLCKDEISMNQWGPHVQNTQVLAVTYLRSKDGLKAISCRSPFKGIPQPEDVCPQDFASCFLDGKPIQIRTIGKCMCKPNSSATQGSSAESERVSIIV